MQPPADQTAPIGPRPSEQHPVTPGLHPRTRRGWRTILSALLVAGVFASGVVVGQADPHGAVRAGDPSTPPAASNPPGGPGDLVPNGAPEDFGVFWEALQLVKDHYVDTSKLSDENLTWGAIRGMVDALGDTGHTVFMTPQDVQAQTEQLTGKISGIGIMVDTRADSPVIIAVFDGGPAAKAGLKAGDTIISVDGAATARLTIDETISRVRGAPGTTVTIGIRHRDGTTGEYPIVRAEIEIPDVSWGFVPGTTIADVRLTQFSDGAAAALKDAITAATDKGATGMVLDLRGNPGGLVDEAVRAASLFLPDGSVVYQQQDRSQDRQSVTVHGSPVVPDLPLVVLADYGSASSAEILAAALRDNHRARIVGQPTFGTGTVLNIYPLSDGSAIRLGVIEWLTPDGQGLFDTGVAPDVSVELPADGTPLGPGELADLTRKQFRQSTDTQLRRAVRLLTQPSAPPDASAAPAASAAP